MKVIFSFFILLSLQAGAQVTIDTLKFDFSKVYPIQPVLRFPLVKTGNVKTDQHINTDLKDRFTNEQYIGIPLDSALLDWSSGNVTYLDFEVTCNQSDVLSFQVSVEVCAAYCSGWTEYFNYTVKNGRFLLLSELIDTSSSFATTVLKDKASEYNKYREELNENFKTPEAEIDSETYAYVLEEYDNCDNGLFPTDYALYPDHLEIHEVCSLQNALKSMDAFIDLSYKLEDIKKFLMVKPW